MEDTTLHEPLARWGMNPPAWLAQFQQLDHQCARAGTPQRVLECARGVAQQRFQAHEPLPCAVCRNHVRCVHVRSNPPSRTPGSPERWARTRKLCV